MISRMDHVAVRLSDGVTLAVPASLSCISTYVLLEQETWFEKEGAFVRRCLKPGMTAIDIGANVGAYSLPMARLVAPGGHVIAYEPASEPRQLLEISRRLNAADNLEIVAAALSDEERQGHLAFGASSELNSLGGAGPGERIRVTCLDREAATCSWQAPDFIKIDAEGCRIVNRPPPRFQRTRGSRPLPIPELGGDLDELRRWSSLSELRKGSSVTVNDRR